MDKAIVIKHLKAYANVVKQNFDVNRIILYGSHSRDEAREDSDIDVAVVLNNIEGDFLLAEAKLFKLRRDIDLRIEPVLLEKSDNRSGFLEEILKRGEIIYSSQ